jgi:hypothetical protein
LHPVPQTEDIPVSISENEPSVTAGTSKEDQTKFAALPIPIARASKFEALHAKNGQPQSRFEQHPKWGIKRVVKWPEFRRTQSEDCASLRNSTETIFGIIFGENKIIP